MFQTDLLLEVINYAKSIINDVLLIFFIKTLLGHFMDKECSMESNKVPLREGVYYNSTHSCLESPDGDIHLTPNEKKILEIILDDRGRKDVIIEEIWHQQGIIVSESSYHQLVKMVRRKFAAAGLPPSCLKTIPRYGMVFRNEPDTEPVNGADYSDITLREPEKRDCREFGNSLAIMRERKEINSEAQPSDETALVPKDQDILLIHSNNLKIAARDTRFSIPYYLSIFIFVVSFISIISFLISYDTHEYFVQVKKVDNVGYHVAPTAKLSEALWQRIESTVLPVTKEVYIASNGPKVWVAYCENSIYKDNVPCTYEHFSLY